MDVKRINAILNRFKSSKKNEQKNNNKKILSTQDYVKKIRNLKEDEDRVNRKTAYDQPKEENKFRGNFDDLNVVIDFEDLEVYDDYVFWGGTIDGTIQFVYKVTPYENTSGIDFNYLEDFTVDNPDNEEIVKRIESYYDQFYKYWRDNVFQTQ